MDGYLSPFGYAQTFAKFVDEICYSVHGSMHRMEMGKKSE
jgi:hypothetical protein